MSKRLTSLLVGAFAVLLLSAPAQAQAVKATKAQASKAIAAYCQQLKLKVDLATSVEFRKLSAEQQAQVVKEAEARIKKNASRNSATLPQAAIAEGKQLTHEGKPAYGKKFNHRPTTSAPLMAPRKAGENVDGNGIITSPAEGEHKFYTREGFAYYYDGYGLQFATQDGAGYAELVECADGTVYFKDIISYYLTGAWVKGTKDGNTITFAAAQPVSYNNSYMATLSVNWGDVTEEGDVIRTADDITFEVDGDVIRLVGSSEEKMLSIFWDDDDSWSGNSDFETVLTLDPTYEPPTLITPPDGVETQIFKLSATQISGSSASGYSANVTVAIDGNDYYIQGMFKSMPNAWIKGTRTGEEIVFPKLQYLGLFQSYNIYLIGVTYYEDNSYDIEDFKMAYDAESKTLYSLNDALANASETEIYYLSWLTEISLPLVAAEEEVAETGAPVDQLPYTNTFNTEEDQAAFGIIDANEDGKTWYFGNGMVNYEYALDMADDWLISPAIYLEAGKNYHFSIDAACYWGYFPERLEVKMGKAPKASEMKQVVIPATDIENEDFQALENETLNVSESGYYHFGVHAISDADMFVLFVDNFLVEPSADFTAPNEVTNLAVESTVTNTPGAVITFNAPTTAINGEPLTENIAKIEIYRDGKLIATLTDIEPGQEIVYEDNDPALTVGTHSYQVIPYNANGIGMKSPVIQVHVSIIIGVPYFADFSSSDAMEAFGVIDANGDGVAWEWYQNGYASVSYNSLEQADDYIVTMPIDMQAGKTYIISADISAQSPYYVPESFEIVVGDQPTADALTTVIVPETDVYQIEPLTYTGTFTCEADGQYYVAVHGVSAPDMFRLNLYTFSITQELTATSLRAPRLSVQPDPYGLDKAVVTLTAPTLTMDGSKVTENIQKIVIYRNGVAYKTLQDVVPGDIKVFTEENIHGAYNYMAVAFDQEGSHGQTTENIKVYVGLDVPSSPSNIIANETVEGIKLSWDAVTTGANGGIIVPDEITYTVYSAHQEPGFFGGMEWVIDEAVATTAETNIELPLDNSIEQTTGAFFIGASNALGESDVYGTLFCVGQPYQMPFEEHFGQTFAYDTWIYFSSDNVMAEYSNESSDDDNSAIQFYSSVDGQYGYFQSGKIAMREGNPTLIVDVKGTGAPKNRFIVKVIDANGKSNTLTSVPVSDEFKTVKVSLADYASDPFVKIQLYCDLKGAGNIIFDNVKVTDLLEYNLTAALEAPKSVKAGETAKVNVIVKNQGERPAKDFTVKLLAGETELINQKVTEDLTSFGTKTFAADFATSIFDNAGDVTLHAEVEYNLELDDEDNVAESVITIKQSSAAQPENVTAQKSGNDVTISWTAPGTSSEEVVEDFEDTDTFPAFSIGGIDENNRYGAFGNWTLYDGNGIGVYGFNGISFDNSYVVQAWQVLNPEAISPEFNSSYAPHSGSQYLISFCPVDESGAPAADHWVISPTLPGIAQTISFWYRTITDQYGAETFEVLYSTTDNKVESFTKLGNYSTTATDWTELSVNLPEGTTYFAIRHTAKDIFGLLIDDITYTRGGGDLTKFNVYVDRELYDDTTATSLVVKNTTAKSFAVSAVYANGQESQPVEVILSGANQEPTSIEELTGKKQPVDIYSLDGKLIRLQATSLQGLKGAYIIEGQKVIVK